MKVNFSYNFTVKRNWMSWDCLSGRVVDVRIELIMRASLPWPWWFIRSYVPNAKATPDEMPWASCTAKIYLQTPKNFHILCIFGFWINRRREEKTRIHAHRRFINKINRCRAVERRFFYQMQPVSFWSFSCWSPSFATSTFDFSMPKNIFVVYCLSLDV